jgi:hemerythrin-like metal-binding protein
MTTRNINIDKFRTGLDWMDDQHAQLIEMTLDLINAIDEKRFERSIKGMLEFLDRYVLRHFQIEDDYMKKTNYPELESHLAEHSEFISTLDNMKKEFESNGSSNYLSGNVKRYLLDWMVNHIGGSDRSMAQFFMENGVQDELSTQDGMIQSTSDLEDEAENEFV